nr:hypothetical protein HannXRQ_Chr16g0506421 [Tanacetum cinerariifolium]
MVQLMSKKYSSFDSDSDDGSDEVKATPALKKPTPPVAKNILKVGSSFEDSFDDGSDFEEEVKAAATKKPAVASGLKVIDFKSYLADLNLYVAPNSKNFYVLVDNGPRLEVLP